MASRGRGRRGARGSSAEFDSSVSFDIFELRADGETLTTFDDAIEDFTAAFSQNVVEEEFIFNFGGAETRLTNVSIPVVDLEPRFIAAGELVTLDGNPVLESTNFNDTGNPPNFEELTTDVDRIEYRFVSNGDELADAGLAEVTLFAEDTEPDTPGFQVSVFTGEQDPVTFQPIFDIITIDDDAAISSVEYIIENDIFDFTNQVRVSATNANDSSQIVSLERSVSAPESFGSEEESGPIDPMAVDDIATTPENTAVEIDVLDNDNVGGIESIGISVFGGSIVQNGDLLEYTPPAGFTGQDFFQYTIDNLGEQDTATVTVNVTEAETPVVPIPPTTPETPTSPEVPTIPEPPTETPLLDGDDVISGDNGDNTLLGGEGNNILYGFGGDDVLRTGSGSDNLQGDNGDDDLAAGGGKDIITGGAGNDLIDGGAGNDTIDGGGQDDSIFGGSGDDLINGGNGDDILDGGAGNDILVGDGGSDIFVLNILGGTDTIRDFSFSRDTLGLSNGITFDQIAISQGNGAAIISFDGQEIASVSGATPDQLDESNFAVI
ncbi:MAG: Ig-like domain-containing protein [Cyanobacteria bacterium J06582_2]